MLIQLAPEISRAQKTTPTSRHRWLRESFKAKAISDASWSEFYRKLGYKMEDHGGILIKVPRTYPSSQICSCCGEKDPDLKDLSIRRWTCSGCGAEHDGDVNAAKNILEKGLEMIASQAS